ncbi:hypothetical protein C8N37_103473 [Sphingobacterium faecium]|nr:hypothetical protein C8N37_103473 [Sphingobacterium faecium]
MINIRIIEQLYRQYFTIFHLYRYGLDRIFAFSKTLKTKKYGTAKKQN